LDKEIKQFNHILIANKNNKVNFNYSLNNKDYEHVCGIISKILPNDEIPEKLILNIDNNYRVIDIDKIRNFSSSELKLEYKEEKERKTIEIGYNNGGICKLM